MSRMRDAILAAAVGHVYKKEPDMFCRAYYFSSEFINRELHYKRDIILFQGKPTPLPEETIEDMKKDELVEYAKSLGIDTSGKTKAEIITAINKADDIED